MARHPDHKYIIALREHDGRLLEELYQRSSPGILRWVTNNNGTVADARDLFQEALISLHRSAHKPDFELSCPIDALIFTICRNQWISQLRRKKTEATVRSAEARRYEPAAPVESVYERLEQEELEKQLLDETLARLSATCQQLLRLLGRGLSSQEAAERMGMTNANTVYRRKNACLKRWRELIEARKGLKHEG